MERFRKVTNNRRGEVDLLLRGLVENVYTLVRAAYAAANAYAGDNDMVEAAIMRERLFTMRMSLEEGTRLDEVAKHYGLNAAGLLRMLVKREHDLLAEKIQVTELRTAKKKTSKR